MSSPTDGGFILAEKLTELLAYGRQRTEELGLEPAEVSARVQEFLKDNPPRATALPTGVG